ncbi:ribosomal protein S18 acetylase RimI-like enzyme [Rhodoblastus acidophilus]|uniref:GNAT family N-acetyltransferase n=1 Tax=Rhodoblastus acidophilus TaxID=1074 RepID=UPI002225A418|nr:GNAT family N-acetyltransferase [Rhodoblastus acidophilus]MCW2283302.1 ribosomal protein S18 acetylase RimI-like enzyme [Rhodoblastus acidophilus]MCW2332162.1 ribosomal protein S18 acetylase RimI-like enzyme [Rhodoblastus acidophilus]
MAESDLQKVNEIATEIHTSLPERPEVFAEKFRLFPKGCLILDSDGGAVGYAISHPWLLNSVPPLDAFLNALPEPAHCLYLHDAAIRPSGRGQSAAKHLAAQLRTIATQENLENLALISVYGTDSLWSRFGFSTVHEPSLAAKLASYGPTAKYMVAPV